VGLVALAALSLSGCFGISMWGTLDGTYTFNKLAYVTAPPAAAGSAVGQASPTWNLNGGQARHDVDLVLAVETEDEDGNPVITESPCRMTANGTTVTGTIGPEGSVLPPPE
jgi:hypothetical protein